MYEQNEVKQNKQTNKQKSPYIYVYIFTYAWFYLEEQIYEHLTYTSKMQQEIASFKQNYSIFV